ncbi:hypothetical protein BGW37DRAFT_25222 [Umbelopsis sp. PMI_123]|nr:hypothetical protein BGW37DRAFT_25222 [Umbelopsis sp. PMI_123]
MSKRRIPASASSPNVSSSTFTFSSNSSREGSSGHTSSTSLSSGNDSSITTRRKQAVKTSVTASACNETGYPEGNSSRTERQRSVTAFLNKLFRMVSEASTNSLIHWSDDGKSFIVEHQDDFSQTLLPRYFKHNTFASFVRQLNMYNFHKVPHVEQRTLLSDTLKDIWEFSNPNFQRGRPDLLSFVYRKRIQEREQSKPESTVHTLLQTSQSIRQRQSELSSEILSMKSDVQNLWKDTLDIREQQQERQESFVKIVQFLSFLTRLIVQSNNIGENILEGDLSKKLLACPETNEILKMAQENDSYLTSKSIWPVQSSMVPNVHVSDEEINDTIASTVRSANAIANDIENLNRNVELIAKRYNYDFDSEDLNFGLYSGPSAADSTNSIDNKLNIIQYHHTGKRTSNTSSTEDNQHRSKKRAGSIGMNNPDWLTTSNLFNIASSDSQTSSSLNPPPPSMPTIALRRATAKAQVPPIISETSLAERFQPPLSYVPIVPLTSDPPSNLVDSTSFDANTIGYDEFAATCDYSSGHDTMNEFSGLFGPPPT